MKQPKSTREKYGQRTFLLRDKDIVERIKVVLDNAPIDPLRPLQLVLREEVKARKPDQNALMFAGPIRDISEQAWFDGRQFSAEILHEWFKREFLPEEYDPELCVSETYRKWDYDPSGNRVLVGSTKDLTVYGFSQHLEQVFAFGASMGVEFSKVPPKDF